MTDSREATPSKVPEVTLGFWIADLAHRGAFPSQHGRRDITLDPDDPGMEGHETSIPAGRVEQSVVAVADGPPDEGRGETASGVRCAPPAFRVGCGPSPCAAQASTMPTGSWVARNEARRE